MKNVEKSSSAVTADEQSTNADVQHVSQPIAKPSVGGTCRINRKTIFKN